MPFDSILKGFSMEHARTLAAFLGPTVNIFGFYFVYKQLVLATENAARSRKQDELQAIWKKAEYISKQAQEFYADPAVKRVVCMLDWTSRLISHPSLPKTLHIRQIPKAQPDDEAANPPNDDKQKEMVVLSQAMLPHTRRIGRYTLAEAAIRDDFDHFLTQLSRFNSLIEVRLFTFKDLEPHICYILDLMIVGKSHAKEEFVMVLNEFIDTYKYAGVRQLLNLRSNSISA